MNCFAFIQIYPGSLWFSLLNISIETAERLRLAIFEIMSLALYPLLNGKYEFFRPRLGWISFSCLSFLNLLIQKKNIPEGYYPSSLISGQAMLLWVDHIFSFSKKLLSNSYKLLPITCWYLAIKCKNYYIGMKKICFSTPSSSLI